MSVLIYEVANKVFQLPDTDLNAATLLKSFAVDKVIRIKIDVEILKDRRFVEPESWDLKEHERHHIVHALSVFGSVTEAADALGIPKQTLASKMEKFKIPGPRTPKR